MSPGLLIAIGWFVMVFIMSLLWKLQQKTSKSGIVDVVWPLGVGVWPRCFACGEGAANQGQPKHQTNHQER